MAKSDRIRLAILGAGPIGLEAALIARNLNWSVAIYERGRLGEHLRRWGHVKMFTPFGMNSTHRGRTLLHRERPKSAIPAEPDLLSGREHVALYLAPLAGSSLLEECLHTQTQVVAVGRSGLLKTDNVARANHSFCLLLRDSQGNESYAEADVVFDCTGVYARHRFLGLGGLPVAGELAAESQIAYGLEDVLGGQLAKYAGRTTLLVGSGYTAATHACLFAELSASSPESWVTWLARSSRSSPMPRLANDPLRERDKLAVRANTLATRGEGNVEFHPASIVERIVTRGPDQGFQVTANIAGESKTWEVDRIVGSVGYAPESSLYRELQVQECQVSQGPAGVGAILLKHPASDCMTMPKIGPAALRTTEANFFILGAKSFGRNPFFLLKNGFEQIYDAFSLLTGRPAASFAGA